jgi:uncharacterized membrane protein
LFGEAGYWRVARILLLLFTLALMLCLVACALNYLLNGESEWFNLTSMYALFVCFIISCSSWLAVRAVYRKLEINENKNKDRFRYYNDPAILRKKNTGK